MALVTAVSQASYAFAPAAFGALRGVLPLDEGVAPALFITAAVVQAAAALVLLIGRQVTR